MGGAAAARGFAVARQMRELWPRAVLSSPFSVRTHVVGLILVIVAPLLAFNAFLVLRSAAHEQEIIGNTVRESARDAAFTIDHELGALRSRLLVLAGSPHLRTGDFAAFHAQAAAAVEQDGLSIVLSDPTG